MVLDCDIARLISGFGSFSCFSSLDVPGCHLTLYVSPFLLITEKAVFTRLGSIILPDKKIK